jgi:hypothetical protein
MPVSHAALACLIAVSLLPGSPARAQGVTIVVPEGTDLLQPAVDAACAQGPGTTVLLEAGEHEITRSLLVSCDGLTLRGAGMDVTTVVWAGLDETDPLNNVPSVPPLDAIACPNGTRNLASGAYPGLIAVVAREAGEFVWPCTPTGPSDRVKDVTIEHLTLKRGAYQPDGDFPNTGIGAVWADNTVVSHVRVDGPFVTGVWTARSQGLTVEHSEIALEASTRPCINFVAYPNRLDTTIGAIIRHNGLGTIDRPCSIGISIANARGFDVHRNTIHAALFGIAASGGAEHNLYRNDLRGAMQNGFRLRAVVDSAVYNNTICHSATALAYPPTVQGFEGTFGFAAPSSGNVYHHNDHYGVPPLVASEDNEEWRNESFAAELCPL